MATITYQNESGSLGVLVVDVTNSESHALESEVTDHEVESGANVSDHIRARLRTLSLSGMVTALPAGQQPDRMRPRDAWATLLHIRDSRQLVIVDTSFESYPSMALLSVDAPRDSSTGDALRLSMTFREVRQVESETVVLPPRNRKAKAKTGDQAGKAPPAKASEKGKKKVVGLKRLNEPLNRFFGLDP